MEITVEDITLINTDAGDTLLVTMSETTIRMPTSVIDKLMRRVASMFEKTFAGKDVKVIVVPYGTEVQLIKSSQLNDK